MIIFYHELDNTLNGGAILMLNLIKGLVTRGNKVVLINFREGAMHKQLAGLDQSLFSVVDNDPNSIKEFARTLSNDDIIITTHFYSVYRFFKKSNPKILFYCVGHSQLIEVNKIFGKLNLLSLTSHLLNFLKANKGVLFIEQNALKQSAKMFSLDVDGFEILPIPIVALEKNRYLKNRVLSSKKKDIGVTYVGRAVDSKIFPVRKIINDIMSTNLQGKNVLLHIATDDPTYFQASLPTFNSDRLRIEFHENLSQQKLDDFLLTVSDIHFGQATSALEGAKLGIPTILIDFAFSEFPDGYRYKFVHETDPAYIGTDVNEEKSFTGLTMEEIFQTMDNTSRMAELSSECFDYIHKNHDLSVITSRLEQHIDNCCSNFQLIKKYLIRYWL